MQDFRNIGSSHFANLSQGDKQLAEDFVEKIFGFFCSEIGFNDYVEFVRSEKLPSKIATNAFFNKLDVDKNGRLNREEAIPLYYIATNKLKGCDVCHQWFADSFFCDVQCKFVDSNVDLCRGCLEGGRSFPHHHAPPVRDNQNLLLTTQLSGQRNKSELQLTAEAYYQNVSSSVKVEAIKFFVEMDKSGDGKIDSEEYISYMKKHGYEKLANYKLFKEINGSGSGQLDFMEVMTLYYIIQSRRPFCEGCDIFLGGLFFTCNDCFNSDDDKPFDVCLSCFKAKSYTHKHHHFVDNYALLESKRMETIVEKKRQRKNETTNYMMSSAEAQPTTATYTATTSTDTATTSTYTAIVPYSRRQKFSYWLSVAGTLTTIVSNCSIM